MTKLLSRGELLIDLVDVSKALGDDSGTLNILIHHINAQLERLETRLSAGDSDLQTIDESLFFAAIETLKDAGQMETARDLIRRLGSQSDAASLEPVDKFKLRHMAVKAILIGGSQAELEDGYKSLIESAGDELASDQVHAVRVEYARELLNRDLKAQYITEVRATLDQISPGFRGRIGLRGETPATKRGAPLTRRVINRLKTTVSPSELQNPDIDRQINEANILQAEGQSKEAFDRHLALAEKGVAVSQMSIGSYFQLGIGCEENHVDARKWYGLSAKQGNIIGHLYLAALLQMGLGGPVDMDEAVKHYRFAAEGGNAQALRNLGSVLTSTIFLKKPDLAAAIECYFRAWEYDDTSDLLQTLDFYSRPLNQFKWN